MGWIILTATDELNNCDYCVTVSLVVMCEDYCSACKVLDVPPTEVIHKGERISTLIREYEYDVWIYSEKYLLDDNIDGSIILNVLKSCKIDKEKVQSLNNIGHCSVRVSIVSDYAQIPMQLLKKTLIELASVGIDLELSVFSWGGASD